MKIMIHECRSIHEQRIFRLPQNVSPRIMMNVGNPETAFSFGQLPNEGIGLARLEFVSWTQHLAMVGRDQPLLGSEKTKVRKLKFEASKLTIHGRLPCNISNYNIFTRHSKKLASLLLVIWRCTKYSLSLSQWYLISNYITNMSRFLDDLPVELGDSFAGRRILHWGHQQCHRRSPQGHLCVAVSCGGADFLQMEIDGM